MNNQHHTCILEADYYLSFCNVHFKIYLQNETRMYSSRIGGVSARGGVFASVGGVYPGWGCLPRGLSAWEVSAQGGGVSATHTHTHPVNRITDACENITLPQLRCGR